MHRVHSTCKQEHADMTPTDERNKPGSIVDLTHLEAATILELDELHKPRSPLLLCTSRNEGSSMCSTNPLIYSAIGHVLYTSPLGS